MSRGTVLDRDQGNTVGSAYLAVVTPTHLGDGGTVSIDEESTSGINKVAILMVKAR